MGGGRKKSIEEKQGNIFFLHCRLLFSGLSNKPFSMCLLNQAKHCFAHFLVLLESNQFKNRWRREVCKSQFTLRNWFLSPSETMFPVRSQGHQSHYEQEGWKQDLTTEIELCLPCIKCYYGVNSLPTDQLNILIVAHWPMEWINTCVFIYSSVYMYYCIICQTFMKRI